MNWDVMLYRAAIIHDLKKCLLNRDAAQPTRYSSWDPDHLRWDDLPSQGPMDDLPGLAQAETHLSPEMLTLIKLHQRLHHKALGLDDSLVNRLDTLTVVCLMAADSLHKALYYGDDYRAKEGEEETGIPFPFLSKQYPFYYPFYGKPCVWLADDKEQLKSFSAVSPKPLENAVAFRNARTALFDPAWKELFSRFPLDWSSERLQRINETYLSSFPDTTYLPITSLNFHHRFVAAIALLLKQDLAFITFPPGGRGRREKTVPLEWALCTIATPPERLTNRLRDTTIVRKISHLLQHRLHSTLSQQYLSTMMEELDFRHPDANPFFFYNKDAIVLICRQSDLDAIEACCQSVATETESVLTMERLPLLMELKFAVLLSETTQDTGWANLQVSNLFYKKEKYEISARATYMDYTETLRQHFWGIPPLPLELQAQAPQEAKHCYHCNKPVPEPEIRRIQEEDELCANCHRMYQEYAYCLDCRVYFKATESSQRKLHDGHSQCSSLIPRLLQGEDKNKTHRVAYIFLQTEASLQAFRQEQRQAPETLLARFRHHRSLFEQGKEISSQGGREEFLNQLAIVKPTRFGIFEYLQAALNMNQLQKELEVCLAESLQWLWEKQKLHLAREAKEYLVKPDDFSKALVPLFFLYRSPTQTLMVLSEAALAHFYRQLEAKLSLLKLSHRVRIVTCDHNHPVWMVLRQLGVPEGLGRMSQQMAERLQELQQSQRRFLENYKKMFLLLKEPARELGKLPDRIDNWPNWKKLPEKNAASFKTYQDSFRKLATPLALYLERERVQRLLEACSKLSGIQPEWRKDLNRMKALLETATIRHQAELGALIESLQRAIQALFDRGGALYEQFDAEQRQKNERLEWFILRGGVQRALQGYWARYLLLDWHPKERIASQFGYLSEFAHRFQNADRERFYDHLFLELEARVWDRHEKGRERIPKALAAEIQEGFLKNPLPPTEVPGLLRELATRQQVDAGLQAASLQKQQQKWKERKERNKNVQSRGSDRHSGTRRRSPRQR